jgi:hypothetical protein
VASRRFELLWGDQQNCSDRVFRILTLNRRGAFDWSQSSFSPAPISVTASAVEWPVLNEADGSAEGGGAEEDDGVVCCAMDDADADAG